MSNDIRLALRLALRELRAGIKGFRVLIASIALGVAAIAAVGTLATALHKGLAAQGRVLLGGDLAFTLVQRRASSEEHAFIAGYGRTSEIAALRSLARLADGSRTALVEVKAVDAAYPLAGQVVLRGGGAIGDLLVAGRAAIVDPILLERLGIDVGDVFRLGEAELRVVGVLAHEPDLLAGRLNFGPRVFISQETMQATGLAGPGSLVRWQINLLLADADFGRDIEVVKTSVAKRFPLSGFEFRDRVSPSPAIARGIDRFSQFLTLLGLAALFIGGVGVANAVAGHVARRRQVIATFKSLGASSRLIMLTYLFQVLFLSAAGIMAGLAIGVVLPALLVSLLAPSLPVDLVFSVPMEALLLAAAYGVLVALIFMLWPLDGARRVRAAELFRSESVPFARSPRWQVMTVILGLLILLVGVAVLTSPAKRLALYAALGFVGLYFGFQVLAVVVRRSTILLPRSRHPELSLARAALGAPTTLVRTVVQSLGIGISLLLAVLLIEHSLTSELAVGLPKNAPNFFVLDIDKTEVEEFRQIAGEVAPGIHIETAPMLRGRVIELGGQPVDEIKPSADTEWVLRGDRGLTFAETLPANSKLVAGTWWPEGYEGPSLVSFEEGAAKGLGLKLGDKIIVNVLGRNIEAEIASLRRVHWESLALNFVMVFSPNTLQAAPYKLLATMALAPGQGVELEGKLVSRVASAFPASTPIAVREALAAVDGVIERILVAVRLASLVILLAGAIALAGAFAATHQQRLREAVIFKVLGATRARILSAHALEYTALALASLAAAAAFGSLAAWIILTRFMKIDFIFSWLAVAKMLVIVLLLVLPLGLLGTWRILGHKSTAELRRE